jgi:hypothetical protein
MHINITVNEADLKSLVFAHIIKQIPEGQFDPKKVKIETKSQQNYRSEWEAGAGFRATYEATV